MEISFWADDAISDSTLLLAFVIILEEFHKNQEHPTINMSALSENEKNTVRFISDLLDDIEILKPEHVDYYMDVENIIGLMD